MGERKTCKGAGGWATLLKLPRHATTAQDCPRPEAPRGGRCLLNTRRRAADDRQQLMAPGGVGAQVTHAPRHATTTTKTVMGDQDEKRLHGSITRGLLSAARCRVL